MIVSTDLKGRKATFQIIFGQKCENATAKKARNKEEGRWISCSKEPTFPPESQVVQFAQKFTKKPQLFDLQKKNNFLRQTLTQISKKGHFLGQWWDHQCPYHLSTLVYFYPNGNLQALGRSS